MSFQQKFLLTGKEPESVRGLSYGIFIKFPAPKLNKKRLEVKLLSPGSDCVVMPAAFLYTFHFAAFAVSALC